MDYSKRTSLEEFAEIYVQEAVDMFKESKKISLDNFYRQLFSRVSERYIISEKDFLFLHHPFHWEMFLPNKNKFSPFEISFNS